MENPFKKIFGGGNKLKEPRPPFGKKPKEELSLTERAYSSNPAVDAMARKAIEAITTAGDNGPNFGDLKVEKMRKADTLALKAHPENEASRFRPGSRLRTYTGQRAEDGSLKDETYKGEATVGEGHTIYRNSDPVMYPADWRDATLRGTPVMGHYEEDGAFVEDKDGSETLYNEYVTDDPQHPMRKYGIEPKAGEWTMGSAQIPSYLIEIPAGVESTEVVSGGKLISVQAGDYLVIDDMGGGKTSVQAVERNTKERSYKSW